MHLFLHVNKNKEVSEHRTVLSLVVLGLCTVYALVWLYFHLLRILSSSKMLSVYRENPLEQSASVKISSLYTYIVSL